MKAAWTGKAATPLESCARTRGCFLAAELGIPNSEDLSNHNAYLVHWLRELENDPKAIFHSATAASKAADFILSFSRAQKPDVEEETSDAAGVTS